MTSAEGSYNPVFFASEKPDSYSSLNAVQPIEEVSREQRVNEDVITSISDPATLKEMVQGLRGTDEPQSDLIFSYTDSESCHEEISQFYAYLERDEVMGCKGIFISILDNLFLNCSNSDKRTVLWRDLGSDYKKRFVQVSMDNLDNANSFKRIRALQSLLYIVQGCWGENNNEEEVYICARENCLRLLDYGILPLLCEHLSRLAEHDAYEMHTDTNEKLEDDNYGFNEPSFQSNPETRMCLNVIYHIIEEGRREKGAGRERIIRDYLLQELSDTQSSNDNLATLLFSMLLRFCNGSAPSLPIKKVILLLWKVLLTSLGGTEDLRELKKIARLRVGLEGEFGENRPTIALPHFILQPRDPELQLLEKNRERHEAGPQLMPKIRRSEVEAFLEMVQSRFVGFKKSPGAEGGEFLADLPEAIHDSLKVLEQHLYIPLSELQMIYEKFLQIIPSSTTDLLPKQYTPYSKRQLDLSQLHSEDSTPAEKLYKHLLPQLPQFMIALLKVLLAATPTKNKTDSLNIYIDVCPSETQVNAMNTAERRRVEIDVHRYTEVVVKGVSAILFLLLKHFKLNHVYQFEFVCHHLVFANCIPLILKFFNQNLLQFIHSRSMILPLEYPSCLLYSTSMEQEMETEVVDGEDFEGSYISWRNLFSCINLLRVLQKLTKWKPSRTMVLVAFKSAQILKKVLKVRHPLIQKNALKLLKMQTRYLGRNWRRNNMKIMSCIYQNVRHHLHDDWAYGNDLNARPCDFQSLEMSLKQACDHFNHLHYGLGNPSIQSVEDPLIQEYLTDDNNTISILNEARIEYDEGFIENWEIWLEEVVFSGPPSRLDILMS